MDRHLTMRRVLLPLALLASSPAHADGFTNREVAFQILNIVDAAQTINCAHHADCFEQNTTMYGSRPSTGKVIGIKAGVGVLHFVMAKFLNDRDPHAARIFQIASIVLQGGVVAANLRFAF